MARRPGDAPPGDALRSPAVLMYPPSIPVISHPASREEEEDVAKNISEFFFVNEAVPVETLCFNALSRRE